MMSAKEKAESIYKKFYGELYALMDLRPIVAKQCAIVSVDLILERPIKEWSVLTNEDKEYWIAVRKEIVNY